MRDTKIHRQKESNAGLVFVVFLTIITAIYSFFMSNPHLIKEMPGFDHYEGHVYEKNKKPNPPRTLISAKRIETH